MTDEFIERRAPVEQSWHLKKEINVSLIISVIGIAVACITGYTDLKRDISLIQADQSVIHAKLITLDNEDDKNMAVMRSMFERMESKLDRLIERQK